MKIDLTEAHGQILAEDILADATYPSADRSMMDGYVIRKEETAGKFRITGEIAAGEVPEKTLLRGEAMRISTGALLPVNGGRVVMQEDCTRDGDTLTIDTFSDSLYIRQRGSEAERGDPVLNKGSKIRAAEMAVLAQTGNTRPLVISTPRILHIATGSELVGPERIPAAGEIRDSNSSLISGLLASLSLSATSHRISDDPDAIRSCAESGWDLLLISGGASVGDHDHGAAVLQEMGFEIHFNKVDLRPGKPLTFATKGNQIAFVIPGNPVSHFVCFHVAIRLALELMTGNPPAWDFLDLEITNPDLLKPNRRQTYWPAQVSANSSTLAATAKPWSTSGDTFSLSGTNALIRVDENPPQTLLLDLPHPTK